MKILLIIFLFILLLTSANSLEARSALGKEWGRNHLDYGRVSPNTHDSLAKEVVQNQIYFSKHHKEDILKHSKKKPHGKYSHKRKR